MAVAPVSRVSIPQQCARTSSKTFDVTSPESASGTAPSADLDVVGMNKDCGAETNGQHDHREKGS